MVVSENNSSNHLEFKKYEENKLQKKDNRNKKNIDKNKIYLKQGTIKTNKSKLATQTISEQLYPNSKEKYYLIQFEDIIKDNWIRFIKSKNIELLNYIPENSYLVKMESDSKKELQSLDYVQYISIYKPEYKVSPSINESKNNLTLTIITFENTDIQKSLNKINSTGSNIIEYNSNYIKVNLNPNNTNISDIAKINSVSWIEEYNTPHILNDDARYIMNVDVTHSLYSLDGSGQTIAIADTGIDNGIDNAYMHPDLKNSITGISNFAGTDAKDVSGHGTHVSGSAVGDGSASNGQYKGTAPNAKLYFQCIEQDDGELDPYPLSDLFQQAYDNGARIHSNSWGDSTPEGDYDYHAKWVDEFIWDHKNMLILFSAGNEGSSQNTVGSPGTAKNCLTVGASESSDPKDIASFSSRGPTDDGRIKPDLVAPGTYITSTRSSYDNEGSGYYVTFQGTSMATPLTAGTAASIRQYFVENSIQPSASLIKTTLINGAYDISSYNNRPNYAQGWGRVDLYNSIISLVNEDIHYSQKTKLSTNEIAETKFYVDDSTKPLRVTIGWTDYPGNPSTSKMLVNDLDLTIIDPSGNEYTSWSSKNNVEDIEIQNPEVGRYTVKVKGFNVPHGPQPFSMVTSGSIKIVDVSNIEIKPENAKSYENETLSFNADVYDQDSNKVKLPVNWTITNTTVGIIDDNGVFTARNLGTTTITAECEGVTESTSVNVEKLITSSKPDTNKTFGKPEYLQEFSIKTNEICDVIWMLNGSVVKSEKSVTYSSYSNNTADIGIYNVTAVASCPNGTKQVSWTWEIHEESYYTGYKIWDAKKDLSMNYQWTGDSYPGLYRNLKSIGNSESMTMNLNDGSDRIINDGDFEYSAKPVETTFKHDGYGTYNEIGFLTEQFFAGYTGNTNFASSSSNMLAENQLMKILINNNKSKYVSTGSMISLGNGYNITPKQIDIDGNKVWFELTQGGEYVHDEVVNIDDDKKNYFVYEKDLGSTFDLPIIVLNAGDVYKSNKTVMIKGMFQVSEDIIELKEGNTYDKLQLEYVNSNEILMDNKEPFSFDSGTKIEITDDIKFKVADDDTLRFTPYTDKTSKGRYNLSGTVARNEGYEWNPMNFEGFYYNLDNGLLSESFEVIYDNDRSIDKGQLIYNAQSIEIDSKCSYWGKYKATGFMGEKHFLGYNDNSKLLSNNMTTKVLMDIGVAKSVDTDSALFLENGYVLVPKQIDTDGNKIWFILYKDGNFIDDEIVSVDSNSDGNFIYEKDLGSVSDYPIISVHVNDIDNQNNEIVVDGIFQISDDYKELHIGDRRGKMEITSINSDNITMENFEPIDLEKGKYIDITDDFKFKVADSDILRYYPLRMVTDDYRLIDSYYPVKNPLTEIGHSQEFDINTNKVCNITWKIDGDTQKTNIKTSSASFKTSKTDTGIYNVTAVVSNSNYTKQHNWSWNVSYNDSDAPDIKLKIDPVKRVSVHNPASVSVSSKDDYPNETKFIVKDVSDSIILENDITDNVSRNDMYTFTWNTTNDSNEIVTSGKYYLIVNSTDAAGNTAKKNQSIVVDNEDPTASITDITGIYADGNKVYTNSTLTINTTASGTPGNLSDIKFVLDSKHTSFKKILKPDYVDNNWSDTVNISSLPDDGEYSVIIKTIDPAGNSNTSKSNINLVLDRQAPELAPSIKRINDTYARVNVTGFENLKKEPVVEINGNDIPVTTQNGYWSGIFELTDNNYTINVEGVDLSGNIGHHISNAILETIETSNNTRKMSNEKTGTSITFNTSDEVKDTVTITETDVPIKNLDSELIGIHFLDVHIGDNLTANLTNATIAIKINKSKLPEGLNENDDVTIRYYNKSNRSWDKVDTNIQSLNGSKYWISNVKHFSTYGAIGDDNTKPVIDEVNPSDGSELGTSTSQVNVRFNYSDNQSGINVSAVLLKFNGNNVTSSENTIITSEYATYNATGLSAGSYNSTINVYDNAENRRSFTTNFEIPENTDDRAPSTPGGSSSDSGGGGGSGGGNTGEKQENIKEEFVQQEYVMYGKHISYEFDSGKTSIESVQFDADQSAGKINTRIEVLKNTSALVDEKAPGEVYQNMNIWVGKAGFNNNIENATINFSVEKSWIENNNIVDSTVHMCRYHDNTWNKLETEKLDENKTKIKYRANTPGFSPFAITGITKEVQDINTTKQKENGVTSNNSIDSNSSTSINSNREDEVIDIGAWNLGWFILAIITMVVSISIYFKKKGM